MTPSTRIVFLLMLLYGKATEAQELISKIPEVSTAKIIAVGESSHSVAEFTKLKADFFRELVKAGITKTLFIESDFSGVSLVNDWVWRRNGEPLDSVMKTGLYRAWRGKDMADLLTWMRDYNSSKPDGERVSIKGVDSQMGKFATPIVEAYLTD
ncbi:MAG: erythromycin esterase family protein, partial [Cytophagales bacterium]|nr:erythromycin esterase family protein [Cytophagales bacterium]